ncbi:transport protein TonB [Sporomusa ovata DSM 2662]|uniref:Ferric siderophore transport system, periplasmic binding protein TonB n=1 Tax=Sporomusa ovata TaxID=2378 RepID=A0A0U1KWE6_9FIRM|nr:energy transducer TonB [Sporomusa ovata]EQB28220.1 transcriptional regulator TonB family [Sporomusa ovata DSM 2662]CQR71758.1 Ferric siderophore transport system, periplasmic binding protein TonB [Sporomusa ovata]
MSFLNNSPFTKPFGISLFLHGALLGAIITLGLFEPDAPTVDIASIGVDIMPASILDTGKTEIDDTPAPEQSFTSAPTPSTSSQQEPVASKSEQATKRTDPLPAAIPGESGENSVVKKVSQGTGTVETAVPGGGNMDEGQGDIKGGGNMGEGQGDKQGGGESAGASCLYTPRPSYPQSAKKSNLEGVVLVRVLIDTDGSAVRVSVRESSGYESFDEAALMAVQKWRFSPAKRCGIPITSFFDVRVRFSLREA